MSIDVAIFVWFLIVNLIVGLKSGRNVYTIKDYALGGRNFSTATLSAGIIATWMAGSNIAITAYETYAQGLYYVIPGIADGLSFFIVAYFYAPRMLEFLGKLSVAEVMGDLYGKHVRLITAISAIIIGIGNVAVQFTVFTTLLNYFFGISGIYASLMSVLIVIVYSTLGGIKAITFTDMIQFLTFGIVLPMSAFIVWKSIHNSELVFKVFTTNPNFNYQEVFNVRNPNFIETLFLFLFFLIPGLDPVIFQRISMARNTSQVSKAFTIAGVAMITIEYGIIALLGVLLLAINVPDLTSDNLVNFLLDNYFNNEFKGFFVIGLVAMLMSTADSYINSTSVLITNDLLKSIGIKLNNKAELLTARLSAVAVGLLALIISLSSQNLLDLILSTYSFYMPIVSVPLLLAIFGFRSSSKAVLIGMFAGFVVVISIKLNFEISSLIPGMLANLLFFIGSHYILNQNGGWVGIGNSTDLDNLRLKRRRNFQKFVQSLKTFNFTRFCESNFPTDERTLVYFGLFSIISIFSNAYSLIDNETYQAFFEFLYYSGLFFAMIFVTYPLWLEKFKNMKIIFIIWNIAVFFNLAFINTLFVILSKFSAVQTAIIMANLITIALLLRWQVAIAMILGGVFAGASIYKNYLNTLYLPESMGSLQFKIIYALLLVSTIMIAFLKPKQDQQKLTEEKNEHLSGRIGSQEKQLREALSLRSEFIRNVNHEYHAPMTGITSTAQTLVESYHKLSDKQRLLAAEIILKSSRKLDIFDSNLSSLSKLSKGNYELNLEYINFSDLVYDQLEVCRKLYEENVTAREFDINIKKDIMINGDRKYLIQVLDNLIINAITYCKEGKIIIDLDQSKDQVYLNVIDEGIGIPTDELENIFDEFIVSSKTRSPAGNRGVGLALCKRVVEVHGGSIKAESNGIKGATFKIVLPL